MNAERMKRLGRDIVDIVMMVLTGAGLSILGTHIIPHVYTESNPHKPLAPGESRLFPSKEAWNDSTGKEKLQMTAFYTGGLAGFLGEIGLYYYHSGETHPAVLAIPVVTNGLSAAYEFYKARMKKN